MEYNILLNVNINDLQSLCQSHRYFNKIGQDPQFWIDRFQQDRLPIMNKQTSVKAWINEYKKVFNAKRIIKSVTNGQINHLSPCQYNILATDIFTLINQYGIIERTKSVDSAIHMARYK